MKNYKLDPNALHELTLAELQALDAAPIDYSDIPPLGGDFFAKVRADGPLAKHQLTMRPDADDPPPQKNNSKSSRQCLRTP